VASVLEDSNLIINLFNYIKANTHEHWTRIMIGSEHYHEFDFYQKKLDSYDGRYMAELRAMGEKLLQDNRERLENVTRAMVDERFVRR
jgi:hypothetical protein